MIKLYYNFFSFFKSTVKYLNYSAIQFEPSYKLLKGCEMIVILAALTGAITGGITAKKRGGNRLDIAQYAAGYSLAFIVVGLISTIVIDRILSS